MTVDDLKTAIGDYLQITFRPASESDNDAGILAKCDAASLVALNHARKSAERRHDFACAERRLWAPVTASGASLTGLAEWVSGGSPTGSFNVKSIKAAWLADSDNEPCQALRVLPVGLVWRERYEEGNKSVLGRYPIDPPTQTVSDCSYLYVQNDKLKFNPTASETINVILDAVVWLDDYAADDDEDWFTQHGSDYLMWAGIVEVNHLFQTFVPRQEGSLSPPTTMRDQALQELIALDEDIRTRAFLFD